MKIRTAVPEDLEQIFKIYETAREYMRRSGNPNQWKDSHPAPELLVNDVHLQRLYLVIDESNDNLLGSFACIEGKDPTYSYIERGSWLNDLPYLTLHRVASAGTQKGILNYILQWTSARTSDIRIDTHEDNHTMQHILEKNGFQKCGIIYLANGEPRLAYHRHI